MTKKIIITLVCIFIFSGIGAIIAFGASDGVDFNKTIKIDEEKVFTIDDVDQLNIKSTSADVNFIYVDSNEIKVKYYGEINCFLCKVDYKLNASKSNNTIEFDANNSSYCFGISFFRDTKMDVYLPSTYEGNLYISTVSSDVKLHDMTLDYLNIRSVSGEVEASNLTLNKGRFKSISGDIDLKNMTVANGTTIHTTSGEISLDTVTSQVSLDSISGDIEIDALSGNLNASSTSGELEINEISDNFDIKVNSVSGDVVLDVNQDASFNFATDSVSGDIKIKFEYLVSGSNYEHHVSGRVGDSLNNININTTSGDITIK
ncbi:DUF4097 family beta strand repeat protein [Mycoplasmatota bacterium]|nr:DUF4097 family beta strand repeat protein [Mycoplasmatota bacterium]